MVENANSGRNSRYLDGKDEPNKLLTPIEGYEGKPLVSLEKSFERIKKLVDDEQTKKLVGDKRIKNLVQDLDKRIWITKENSKEPMDNLSQDESAAIHLYSMQWPDSDDNLCAVLNKILRLEKRDILKPWFSYLKLFLTALFKLPSKKGILWRGIRGNVSDQYKVDKVWWGFSSCTEKMSQIDGFLGQSGERTIFMIECVNGKAIRHHSQYPEENEILLIPGSYFRVIDKHSPSQHLYIIHLQEVKAPHELLKPPFDSDLTPIMPLDLSDTGVSSEDTINSHVTTIKSHVPSSRSKSGRKENLFLKANRHCPQDREMNILLLGQTGVGKSTFINAFANYIINDTLEQAVNDEMQVMIPFSFSYADRDTSNIKTIVIGKDNEHEKISIESHSNTQLCSSFVFPIGNRNLRFIDTPSVGDTRGIAQDAKNFQEILTYITQYEHLNAVFIMLKPNEERSTELFRFCVNELLRHLHVNVKDNIVFVFTNARDAFFMPGSTKKLLEVLLEKHRREHNVNVPFSRDNTFLFDNEPFRYLALCKNGVRLNDDQTQSYTKSWDHSVKECGRVMRHINGCTPHAISNMLSLNAAEQLVRMLNRPLTETARLIEENIQLVKDHKKNVLKHITYEYNTNRIHINLNKTKDSGINQEISLRDIDQRISDLREESAKIHDVYKKLAKFLHANAMLLVNDDFLYYLRYFIREEQMKQNAGARNTDVIAGLEKLMAEFTSDMDLFKKALKEQKESGDRSDVIQSEEIFTLVGTLYRLPITGKEIRQQVEAIKICQDRYGAQHENYVELPEKAASSKLMLQLKGTLSAA